MEMSNWTALNKIATLENELDVEVLRVKKVEKNIYVVLADRGHEFVTWMANLHPGCEGFCHGHYFRRDVYDTPDDPNNAYELALADFNERR